MNKKDIYKYFKYYINGRKMITKFKKKGYLCRHLNFPSEISENLVRIFIKNKSGDDVIWNTKSGDLYNKTKKKIIEVKAFSSSGPTSFGPTEKWDKIYFVDLRHILKCIDINKIKVKIYFVDL